MHTLLSTKKLTPSQRCLLLQAGISVIDYNFIEVSPVNFIISAVGDYAIFTSINAVKSVFSNASVCYKIPKNVFCVGEKTAQECQKYNRKIVYTAQNAMLLARYIVENHKTETFSLFLGDLHRKELIQLFEKNGVAFQKYIVYKTKLTPIKIKNPYLGILFFSPSGVASFLLANKGVTVPAFCIGKTTAHAIKEKNIPIIISEIPSVENVINECINYFKNNP